MGDGAVKFGARHAKAHQTALFHQRGGQRGGGLALLGDGGQRRHQRRMKQLIGAHAGVDKGRLRIIAQPRQPRIQDHLRQLPRQNAPLARHGIGGAIKILRPIDLCNGGRAGGYG